MKKRLITCGLLAIIVGCGRGNDTKSDRGEGTADAPAGETKTKAKPWDPSLGTATVSGVVKFSGKLPRRRPIDTSAEPQCSKQHSGQFVDESVIVNPDGTLKNVFVWVKKGLEGWRFPAPSEPAVLDQKGCTFHPHVQEVQAKQPITIRNSDSFLHNVHVFAKMNRGFNFGQPKKGMEATRNFSRPEVMVRIKCDVHGWMGGYIGVVGHPYFATTGEKGTFELKNLPPGEYTIEAWHEVLGKKTAAETLADNESKSIEFAFEGK